jgi:2-polyprenyl-6-methoxyphenol hydroxylase-like FAD-dependent oxidoreductase
MATTQPLRVLITGASIAGPAAAYFFSRAGATVTVLERSPVLRLGGQRVDIRRTGVNVMRKVPGMEAAVRSKAPDMDGVAFVNSAGKPYGVWRATGDPDQQSLISEFEILRGELGEILYDLTKEDPNVQYVFGNIIASVEYDHQQSEKANGSNPVRVSFRNNNFPSSDYDLVVACDGAHSATRAMFLNCSPRKHIKSTNCWAAYFTFPGDLLNGSRIEQAHSAPGGRFIAIGSENGLTRATLMKFSPAAGPDDRNNSIVPLREAMKEGDDALKRYVAEQFTDCGWLTPQILAGMKVSTDLYASEIVRVHPQAILTHPDSAVPFALVGDAASAPGFTGTATSLALTAAYILAGEVGTRHRGDVAAGLRSYEAIMRPIINEMSYNPPLATTIMAPQTRLGIWIRNMIFALLTRFASLLNPLQKRFAPGFGRNDEVRDKLPTYEWVR